MKSWIILFGLVLVATVAASVAVPLLSSRKSVGGPPMYSAATIDPNSKAPLVEVDQNPAFNFGVMTQDAENKHSWIFKNTGQGTLELRNLGTDCSCTIAQIGKESGDSPGKQTVLKVVPGGAEPIELKWKTNKNNDGAYRKSARIGTNDPRRQEIVLSIEGKVHPAVILVPKENVVSFFTVSNDADSVQHLGLYSPDRPETKITRLVTSNPDMFSVSTHPMAEDDLKRLEAPTGHVIDVTLKPGDRLGDFAEELVIETDHPRQPEMKLKIVGKITGPISHVPDRVLGRGITSSDGGSVDVTLLVRSQTSTSFEVVSRPEPLVVSIEKLAQGPTAKGGKYRLNVQIPPGTPEGHIKDEIVLKTDHPKARELKIPIDIIVEASR